MGRRRTFALFALSNFSLYFVERRRWRLHITLFLRLDSCFVRYYSPFRFSAACAYRGFKFSTPNLWIRGYFLTYEAPCPLAYSSGVCCSVYSFASLPSWARRGIYIIACILRSRGQRMMMYGFCGADVSKNTFVAACICFALWLWAAWSLRGIVRRHCE